ncbi:MAG: hypothetical protein ACTHQQ_21655 [Solirubrobacteraceae bacterium]
MGKLRADMRRETQIALGVESVASAIDPDKQQGHAADLEAEFADLLD